MEEITKELIWKFENSDSKEQIFDTLMIEFSLIKVKLEQNNILFTSDESLDIKSIGSVIDVKFPSDINAYNQINFIRKCLVLDYWDGDAQDEKLKHIKTRIREIDNMYKSKI